MVLLVGGEGADTELVEAVVEAVMIVVVVVSVEDFDDGCCWVHTSEIGRADAVVGGTTLLVAMTPVGCVGFTATTPGEPCGVTLLLLSFRVCCDYWLGKEHNTHIGGRYKEMDSDSGGDASTWQTHLNTR